MVGEKILIVEDDSIAAMDIKKTVESFGYSVPYVASSVKEAIRKASEIEPDLILMDIVLKDEINGIEAISKINSNIPFIYLTAHSEESTIKKAKITRPEGQIIKLNDITGLKYAIELAIYKNQMDKELKESKKKFNLILENSPLPYQSLDENGNFLMVNAAWSATIGYSADEVIGKNFADFLAPGYREHFKKNFPRFKEAGEIHDVQFEMKRKDGSYIHVSYEGKIGYDQLGHFKQTHCIFQDITERKKAEKALFESEKNYRELVDNSMVAMYKTNINGDILFANEAMSSMFGYSAKEFERKKASELYKNPEDRTKIIEKLKKEFEFSFYEVEMISKSGEIINILLSAHLENNIISGMMIDITELKQMEKMMEKSVLSFRALAEYSVDGIITTDDYGKILYLNNSLLKMFGYTQDELQNCPLTILMPERYRKGFLDSLKKLRLTGEHKLTGKTIETLGLNKEGKEFPFEMSLTKWETDGEIFFTSIIRDTTDREKSLRALKESQKKFKSLVDNAADILIVHDNRGNIIEVNKQACESLQYSPEELVQMNIMDIEQDVNLEYAKKQVWPKIKPYKPFNLFGHLRRKDESVFPVEVRFAVVNIQGKKLFMGLARDITERLNMENALKESEIKYKSLFESNPDYTILSGLDGVTLDVNVAAEKIIGLSKEELVGKHFSELKFFPTDEIKLHGEKFSHLLKQENVAPYESRIFDKNADLRWVITSLTLILEDNTPKYILIINSDITERKKNENQMIKSLEEKEILLREIHHRVKNNMQIISSLLNLQIQHVENIEAVNILKESQGRVKSMAMVHEKLYQSPHFNNINFKEYVKKLVFDIFYSYGIKTETIEYVLNIENINIAVETAIPLGLIINELVTNSVKYAFPKCKGTIKIELKPSNQGLELIVADNGIGLPKKINIHNTSTLGLKLVNSLVKQIDGQIELDRNNGTSFRINFKEQIYKDRLSLIQ